MEKDIELGIEKNVYVYKDKRVGTWSTPIFSIEPKEAYTRGVIRAALTTEKENLKYARDQALYLLGTFNDGTGKFELLPEPEHIIDVGDYLNGK